MATFKTRIEELVGEQTDSATLDNYLTATASELLQVMPITDLLRYAEEEIIQDDNGFDTKNKRVLGLVRDGYNAQEVNLGMKTQVVDPNSIHFSAKRSPVFYYDGGTVFVKPAPSAEEQVQFKFVTYPTVLRTDESITGYPETAEYAVVLGACVKILTKVLNTAINENEDIELSSGIKNQLDTINGLYQAEVQRLGALQ